VADSIINQMVLDTMFILNAAVVTFRLYPSESVMVRDTFERLQRSFNAVFEITNSVVLGISEKNIIINGTPLSRKDNEKPHVSAFLEMLHNHSIKSVTFNKGLGIADLMAFTEIMAQRPEEIVKKGGADRIAAEMNLRYILFNEVIYVARGKDQQIVSELDITDNQIIEYILGQNTGSEIDFEELEEKMKDPEWVARIFQVGMEKISSQRGMVPLDMLTDSAVKMIRILDKVTDKVDQDILSMMISRSIANLDDELVGQILIQQIENLFGGHLYNDIISHMDERKFEQVIRKIDSKMKPDMARSRTAKNELVDEAYQRLMQTEKGKQLKIRDDERVAKQRAAKEKEFMMLQEEIRPFFAGGILTDLNKKTLEDLTDIVWQLKELGDQETISTTIEQLTVNLLSGNPDIRANASDALLRIMDHYDKEERFNMIERIQDKLIKWFNLETVFNPSYEAFCNDLSNLAMAKIRSGNYLDSLAILDTYSLIDSRKIERDGRMLVCIAKAIRNIASEEIMRVLLNEIFAKREEGRADAIKVLSSIGRVSIPILLDILREEPNSNERVRIMEVIIAIGPVAIDFMLSGLKEDKPWYYKRNLIYLLGRVGNEDHATVLQPLLKDTMTQIRQEAVKSINRIGGTKRGMLLLPVLMEVSDDIKIGIVESIGSLRYHEAVRPLLTLLKERPPKISETRILLEEKICKALGSIASPEASQVLKDVSKPTLFSIKAYPSRVRSAASGALKAIQLKQDPFNRAK